MQQPAPKGKNESKLKNHKKIRKHKEFGTSKLEEKFAREFLDKLGVEYEYQFKAESIGRYFDFYLPKINILIEVDGDYFHGRGLRHEDKTPMQKRNERVDKQKNLWASLHGIPLIRIWEYDINNNKSSVMEMLKNTVGMHSHLQKINDEKKKRH